ncbi:MAG: hypothetical protein A4E19_20055 [Nitrospira sp. SG-bin1]|nr:MAG: hypothetical protein A4E19_20055 [Nitrospira sp. SG-bin1]
MMKPTTVFRSLILVVPLVGMFTLLIAVGQHVSAGGRLVSFEAPEQSSSQQKQNRVARMTEREQEAFDKFVAHEARFKDHYRSHFSTSHYDYNQYRPAYQHGFELALDPRYRKPDWNGVEPQVRGTWNESTMGLWNQYKDAVRYGWEQGMALEGK